ncbi:HAD family phosphatase [Streptomyces sp. NP160]|uniref:HAD family hydrolase n=1 Tax=Streptomyces sp. NP160 TaxID=2586637 RepID=UPI00111914C2|nr:HAD family hydrolase [Streptomyces sp. NP160]TNM64305.1 HAD family phosphatase [Streptomyces sp. NP160]
MSGLQRAAALEGLVPGGRFDAWEPHPDGAAAVFLDVDGTTLDTEPYASGAVVEAAARATAAGAAVGFATGRLPRGLDVVRGQLASAAHARQEGAVDVAHNGAVVLRDGQVVARWPLPREAAHALVRWCVREGVYAELYSGAAMFVTDRRPEAHVGWAEVSGEPDGDAADLLSGSGAHLEVDKATVDVFEVHRTAEVTAVLEGLGLHVEDSTAPFLPGVPVLNATAPGVTKGSALRWWARSSGTPLQRVVAVGDGQNDLSLLGAVGTGVAMGQAEPAVRAAAHLVSGPVERDGAATVLSLVAEGRL